MNTSEYIGNIGKDKFWATDLEISITSFILGINIAVYKTKDNYNLKYLYSFISNEDIKIPLLVLWNENLNHFNIILYKDYIVTNNDNNNDNSNISLKKNQNSNIIKNIINNKPINSNNKDYYENTIINKEDTNCYNISEIVEKKLKS